MSAMGDLSCRARSVSVQVVLYDTPRDQLLRLVDSVSAAVRRAVTAGKIDSAVLCVGDCSAEPVLGPDEVRMLRRRAIEGGISDARYRFYDANLGSAEGNNRLLGENDTDLILFLNPDTVVDSGLLLELVKPLADPRVGLVEARQVPFEHPKPYDRETGETSWATMACLLARRQVIDDVGPLDSATFFLYCDDVDYSWRVRLAGWTICYQPCAIVFHDKRINAEGYFVASETMQFYNAEGALLLACKYGHPDALDRLLDEYERGSEDEQRAARSFCERRSDGRVPAPVPNGELVAQFVGRGFFSEHRF